MSKYKYGNTVADVENAAGVAGILIRTGEGFVFRVPNEDNLCEFKDYVIRHDDLSITICEKELASFYTTDTRQVLDHSPEVLGRAVVE